MVAPQKIVVFPGSQKIEVRGNLPGPIGPEGPQGPQGIEGEQGPTGLLLDIAAFGKTNQAIPASTNTDIVWDGFLLNGGWNSTEPYTDIAVPVSGTYEVMCALFCASATIPRLRNIITLNGVSFPMDTFGPTAGTLGCTNVGIRNLTAGQIIKVIAWSNLAGGTTISSNSRLIIKRLA